MSGFCPGWHPVLPWPHANSGLCWCLQPARQSGGLCAWEAAHRAPTWPIPVGAGTAPEQEGQGQGSGGQALWPLGSLTGPGSLIPQDCPGIFSAGLDLMEMCGRNPAHYVEYWKAVQELWLRLYLSKLVLIAAINVSVPTSECSLTHWALPGDWGMGVALPSGSPCLEGKGSGETHRHAQVSMPCRPA